MSFQNLSKLYRFSLKSICNFMILPCINYSVSGKQKIKFKISLSRLFRKNKRFSELFRLYDIPEHFQILTLRLTLPQIILSFPYKPSSYSINSILPHKSEFYWNRNEYCNITYTSIVDLKRCKEYMCHPNLTLQHTSNSIAIFVIDGV